MSYTSLGLTLSSGASAKVGGGGTMAGSKKTPPKKTGKLTDAEVAAFFGGGAKKAPTPQCAGGMYLGPDGKCYVQKEAELPPGYSDPVDKTALTQIVELALALEACCSADGATCDCPNGSDGFNTLVAALRKLPPERRARMRGALATPDPKMPPAARSLLERALDAADAPVASSGTPTWQYVAAGVAGATALVGVAWLLTRKKNG